MFNEIIKVTVPHQFQNMLITYYTNTSLNSHLHSFLHLSEEQLILQFHQFLLVIQHRETKYNRDKEKELASY